MKLLAKILLLSILLCCFSSLGFAEEENVSPCASEVINRINVGLSLSASGNSISATATVNSAFVCDQIGFSSFKLQEKRDGSWVTVASAYSQYGYGVTKYNDSLTYSGVKEGLQYRAICTAYAKDGSTSDTRSATSNIKTA